MRLPAWAQALRPADPGFAAAMARRWAELPEPARTPGQTLGRHGVGCEGTHGIFPRCDLACTPCYHSSDANQVRVDGAHTLSELTAQLALLGPNGAGKTTLLSILATVNEPDAGRVSAFGLDPRQRPQRVEIRRRLGYLPQELGYHRHFTVAGFLDYVTANRGSTG